MTLAPTYAVKDTLLNNLQKSLSRRSSFIAKLWTKNIYRM